MELPKAGENIKILSLAKSEGKKVKKVQLLGSTAKMQWSQTKEGLVIKCPQTMPCKSAIVFRID